MTCSKGTPANGSETATEYHWQCLGSGGGTTDTCSASKPGVDGVCGSAAKTYSYSASGFSGALCAVGSASPASPAFPAQGGSTNWICLGENGGSNMSCSASRASAPADGACGAAAKNYLHSASAFSGALCAVGSAVPASPSFPAQGSSTTWTCSGSNGGFDASCSATRASAPIDGSCGTAAKSYPFNAAGFSGALCAVGSPNPASPAFPPHGASVTWTCAGSNGGLNASCTASHALAPINGECGPAATNYASTASNFNGALCSAGSASPASPPFPASGNSTSWTCSGSNGGTSPSCTASRAATPGDGVCGPAATSYAYNASGFSGSLCSAGSANPSAPTFPGQGSSTTWTCAGSNGGASPTCTASRALAPVDGSCGPAATNYAHNVTEFSGALCSSGSASPSAPAFPYHGSSTSWTCAGSNGGSSLNCTASRGTPPGDGACGPAAKSYAHNASAFSGALCSAGSASPSAPAFPGQGSSTTWTCAGSNGGASPSCTASRASAPINAVCGPAATNYAHNAIGFSGALCTTGTANPSSPTFPAQGASVTWTCSGSNGGTDQTCTAGRSAAPGDGVCGPAATSYAYNASAFSGALCSSGSANPSSPSFPAQGASTTWTCAGSNGGASPNCTASRASAPINAVCGPAATNYAHNAIGFSGALCATGTANPSSPTFPAQGASVTWTCSGSNGGASPNCSASRALAPVDGVCGPAAMNYAYNASAFSGVFCTTGTANPVAPTFPNQGASTTWTCSGSNGGTSPTCTASRGAAPVNGVCGPAAKSYAYNASAFTGVLCSTGTATPASPTFPAQGASVSWTCSGSNGGTNPTCTASRALAPVNGACGDINTLCTSGVFVDQPDTPPNYYWKCTGLNGGTDASCSATTGVCGTSETCLSGTKVDRADNGKVHLWGCAGTNGFGTVDCSATDGQCGTVSNNLSVLCPSGQFEDVADAHPKYYWRCKGINGGATQECSADYPVCGIQENCTSGTATDKPDVANVHYWSCTGTNGFGTIDCQSADGLCGNLATPCTAGTFLSISIAANYWSWQCIGSSGVSPTCNAGNGICSTTPNVCQQGTVDTSPADTATTINWRCRGWGGGSNVNCSATKPCQYRVSIDSYSASLDPTNWTFFQAYPFVVNVAAGANATLANSCITKLKSDCGCGFTKSYDQNLNWWAVNYNKQPALRKDGGNCNHVSCFDRTGEPNCWNNAWCDRFRDFYGQINCVMTGLMQTESGQNRCNAVPAAFGGHRFAPANNAQQTNYGYLDASCNVVSQDTTNYQMCDLIDIDYFHESPISLVWEAGAEQGQAETFNKFPLAPGADERWHAWKASGKLPLLVFDPTHTGKVTSGKQLFGTNSFGKRFADGYQALATLDLNKDGKVSGPELKDLDLWFDNNQDGVSQDGEVKRLTETGVTALYFKKDGGDLATSQLIASHGYDRTVDGKDRPGASIDWFPRYFDKKLKPEELKQQSSAAKAPQTKADYAGLFSGSWAWSSNDARGPVRASGNLVMMDEDGVLKGVSVSTQGVEDAKTEKVVPLTMALPLTGEVKTDAQGRPMISFVVAKPNGRSTYSEAVLNADGILEGRSRSHQATDPKTKEAYAVDYTWTAKRSALR